MFASKATHAPNVVVRVDGARMKLILSVLAMFVYTLIPSVAEPHIPPPSLLPGPANCKIHREIFSKSSVILHTKMSLFGVDVQINFLVQNSAKYQQIRERNKHFILIKNKFNF